MKIMNRAILAIALVLCLAGISEAQTALTQTTLSAAVSGPAMYSGTSVTIDSTVTLASVSGISAPTLPGTPVSVIYVGREAMGVFSVNTSTKQVGVLRGYLGTQASPHPSGDMVLVAPQYNVTASGGNPVPNGLFAQDPPQNGSCTVGNTPTTPWVNVLTGAQWLCSSITSTWVPGFNNPLNASSAVPTTAVASATSITPSGPLFHLTGTTAVTTITTPIGCNATAVGACEFVVIVDTGTASQFGTGGNLEIAAAITTLTGKAYTFTWDAKNSKWVVQG